jgi:hypothetical protein
MGFKISLRSLAFGQQEAVGRNSSFFAIFIVLLRPSCATMINRDAIESQMGRCPSG